MSFFGVGNPFASPVGQKIEQATDGSLPSENWALNMEICDIINSTPDGPKDAIKAIRKRLTQSAGKNYTIVMYTLTVLESCVKNCGRPFHVMVCSKEFISELVKLIGPKNDPPTVVQDKVLSLIQCWADAFQTQPELQGVVQVYNELRTKGVEFPMTDLDAMAPIFTPQRLRCHRTHHSELSTKITPARSQRSPTTSITTPTYSSLTSWRRPCVRCRPAWPSWQAAWPTSKGGGGRSYAEEDALIDLSDDPGSHRADRRTSLTCSHMEVVMLTTWRTRARPPTGMDQREIDEISAWLEQEKRLLKPTVPKRV
ncbi:unnamed protein product [Leptidea sinapis]|uniref:VHS domain-containing protein n=1 Tax=Leptidea sinapis TaxID=189913 RepID=A0A5E4R1D8_9NEOP|nr:unnamed protein product [Leptidea sinapis]